MDLSPVTTTVAAHNQKWLASKHGVDTAYPVTLDITAFAGLYPDGFIPSGVALGIITASGKAGPYDNGAADGTETLAGFLLEPLSVKATSPNDVSGALFWHGRVATDELPIAADSAGGIDSGGSYKADLPTIHFTAKA